MTRNHMHAKEFIVGAAIGGLLGSMVALLVAPKSGKKLRDDISDSYCDLSEKTHDLIRKGRCFAKSAGSHTDDWAKMLKASVNGVRKSLQKWRASKTEEDGMKEFAIGGLAGGIAGALLALIIAPKPGKEIRQDIMETYEDVSDRAQAFANDVSKRGRVFVKRTRSKADKWLDLAKDVVEDVIDGVEDTGENLVKKAKKLIDNSRIHDLMDWAALGARVWQGIKSKR